MNHRHKCRNHSNGYTTWQVLEEYIPLELQEQYRKVFISYDTHGTGVIHIENVAEIISKYGKQCSVENIRRILDSINTCDCCLRISEDFVDFPEFLVIVTKLSTNCVPEDEMHHIFKAFDENGDGFIALGELRHLFQRIGEEISETELEEMILEADKDGDGLVSYQEFVQLITSSNKENLPKRKSPVYTSGPITVAMISQETIETTDDNFKKDICKPDETKHQSKRQTLSKKFSNITRPLFSKQLSVSKVEMSSFPVRHRHHNSKDNTRNVSYNKEQCKSCHDLLNATDESNTQHVKKHRSKKQSLKKKISTISKPTFLRRNSTSHLELSSGNCGLKHCNLNRKDYNSHYKSCPDILAESKHHALGPGNLKRWFKNR